MSGRRSSGIKETSVLSAAYQYGVPIFTSSPGDSSIGMNVAAMALRDSKLLIDVNRDVNQTAAIVYGAKSSGATSSVFILGGGSPKNFMLQTEPQIQEVMGIEERGHDYFLQCTDARPDTGGLSGATPGEAVSWGKIDPENLPDCVVCYADSTITLPLITAYALTKAAPRKLKRLYDRRDALYAAAARAIFQARPGREDRAPHRHHQTEARALRTLRRRHDSLTAMARRPTPARSSSSASALRRRSSSTSAASPTPSKSSRSDDPLRVDHVWITLEVAALRPHARVDQYPLAPQPRRRLRRARARRHHRSHLDREAGARPRGMRGLDYAKLEAALPVVYESYEHEPLVGTARRESESRRSARKSGASFTRAITSASTRSTAAARAAP